MMEGIVRISTSLVQTRWWVAFILLAMLVVGCTEGDVGNVDESKSTGVETAKETKTEEVKSDIEEQQSGQLELIEWSLRSDEYNDYVVGIVENNTADELWVSIVFGTYDADGFKMGETQDAETLGAGEKWKFEAMIFEDNVDTVKVISLEGW
jgi:hypothetical protein